MERPVIQLILFSRIMLRQMVQLDLRLDTLTTLLNNYSLMVSRVSLNQMVISLAVK